MNPYVRVLARPPTGTPGPDDLRAFSEACAAILPTLTWVGAPFDPAAGQISQDGTLWGLQIELPRGGPTMMKEMMQIAGLTAVCSRARPDWVFELASDSELLEAELGPGPCFQNGRSLQDDLAFRKALVKYVDDPGRFGVEPVALDHRQDFLIDTSFLYDPAQEAPAAKPSEPEGAWVDDGPALWIEGTNAAARPHPTEPVAASWRVRSLPRDADGDLKIEAEVLVFNALSEGGRVGMLLDLVDPSGALICSLSANSRRPLHEGERVTLSDRTWLRRAPVPRGARVRLWVKRSEGTLLTLGRVRPSFQPADEDLGVPWQLRFEVQNPGAAWDEASLLLQWTDAQGEPDDAVARCSLAAIPSGLSVHEVSSTLYGDEARYAGREAVAMLELLHVRWQRVEAADVPCLTLPGLAPAPAVVAAPAPVAPVTAAPVTAAPAPTTTAPVPSLDDRLKSGDPAVVVAACEEVTRAVDRSRTSRVRTLLSHADPSVRAAAATALGAIGGPALTVPLRRLVQDADANVRAAAVAAIARLEG